MKFKKISDIPFVKSNINFVWRNVVGKLADKCYPKSFEKGILTLQVVAPAWSHHINFLRHDIIKKVKDKTGIEILRIKLINSSFYRKSTKNISFYNENNTLNKVSPKKIILNIKNRDFKSRFERIASLSIARKKSLLEENWKENIAPKI